MEDSNKLLIASTVGLLYGSWMIIPAYNLLSEYEDEETSSKEDEQPD